MENESEMNGYANYIGVLECLLNISKSTEKLQIGKHYQLSINFKKNSEGDFNVYEVSLILKQPEEKVEK